MSTVLKETAKIDRLSHLPPELLDDIFDLVAFSHRLCTVPPSKSLRPFHEKALYMYLKFDSFPQFQKFAETINAQPTKAALTRGSTWRGLFNPRKTSFKFVRGVMSKLLPAELEIGPYYDTTTFFDLGLAFGHFANLHTFTLHGYRPASLVYWLSKIPSLRTVDLMDVSFAQDVFNTPTARQVTALALTTPRLPRLSFFAPLQLLPFFPSAAIVKLDLVCIAQSEYDAIPSIISKLTPSLRILRLESAFKPRLSPTKPLDKLLPRFSSLQKLYLDSTFLPRSYETDILSLSRLVDLNLVLKDFDPDFIKLLEGPTRLRYLRKLSIEFGPIKVGKAVDLDHALTECEANYCVDGGKGLWLLERTDSFAQMPMWELPLADEMLSDDEVVEALELAEKMERIARESDINVSTNLKAVRRAFHRHLIEYYNRGVGYLYLYWKKRRYDAAVHLAKRLEINLPVLEIDLKERIERGKLEWFRIRMEDVETDGGKECYALSLRRTEE
ncbi:hypothetical protein JCM5353_000952 [Sporobolomyces roseus]